MEKERDYKAHVLVFPYPSQGHISPLLQFSKRLVYKGLKATLVTTTFISKSMQAKPGPIEVVTISDGYDDGGFGQAESIEAYLKSLEDVGSKTLAELMEKLASNGHPVDCLIYDAFLPWALDLAKRIGIMGASFFTQTCAINNIYYHVHRGLLPLPIPGPTVTIPGLPTLDLQDMPSFIYVSGSYPAYFQLVLNQMCNIDDADWIFFNTFEKLEAEIVEWMAKLLPVKTIGPTIPSLYLDKRIEDDKEYGIDLFTPNSSVCMNWLDSKPIGSVVYMSFGSMASLDVEQMEELAWGLRGCNKYFLWAVRASEESKLSTKLKEETAKMGLIVTWCSQLEVLAHQAVGCFVTHCGWNSTIEALSLGVPMVGVPQWTDQTTNAKFVEDIWGIGVRARVDEKGMVRREEMEKCIKEVMEGKRVQEIKRNANKWRELAIEAVDEGGSSDKTIDEFVTKLKCTRIN